MVSKTIDSILTEVRDTLQDQQRTRWTNQELYRYIDQANRNIAVAVKHIRVVEPITIVSGTDTYTMSQEVIEYNSVATSQDYTVLGNKSIKFPRMSPEDIEVEYFAYPARVIYGVTQSLLMEDDLYDALKFFVLNRAYQKEASTENISKADYFKQEYSNILQMNSGRWHGQQDIDLYRRDYLTT